MENDSATLHRLTHDVQYSTRFPKTHVGGPDLDQDFSLTQSCYMLNQLDCARKFIKKMYKNEAVSRFFDAYLLTQLVVTKIMASF